jgi:hypothetical protein
VRWITGLDWPLLALAGSCWRFRPSVQSGLRTSTTLTSVILLLQCVPYAIATWLVVWGRPDRAASGRALATILLVGVAMRCLLLPGTPVSNDLFRYVWDGRVQAAGINPYLHVPIGLPIYVPCILILITEFALRRRRKTEEPHADAVIA